MSASFWHLRPQVAELAELAGVSRQTVVKVEGGLEPRPTTVRKLAKALGVEQADLMEPAA
jgi:transcriptional regulator with XRE-family HTH domain